MSVVYIVDWIVEGWGIHITELEWHFSLTVFYADISFFLTQSEYMYDQKQNI